MVPKCLKALMSGFPEDLESEVSKPYHTVGDVSRVLFLFLFSSLGFKSCALYDSKAFDF